MQRRAARGNRHLLQRGLSLVELMVAMTLSLLLILAAAAFYLTGRANYNTIDDTTALDEKGRFAVDTVVRIIRQAAWTNYAGNSAATSASGPLAPTPGGVMLTTTSLSPTISGLDNCGAPVQDLSNAAQNLACPAQSGVVNKSDVLQVRFFGSGTQQDRTVPDHSMIDCSGNGVAEPQAWEDADLARGMAIFYVASDASGMPQLMCGYRPRDAANKEVLAAGTPLQAVSLISGVEVFQVLYGVDTNFDQSPDRYLSATEVLALSTTWQNVVSLKLSMVLMGDAASASPQDPPTFRLFGNLYAGSQDNDTSFTPATNLQRMRRLYTVTVQLRNMATCTTCSPT
ncbi:Type IV pilus assembly protein PilW [Cupriavidus oxalaticus]|uniref:PilW family protein n=1 Tax=Cupriavidus oxalaticus TaxID=96344 RepID=UPI003F737941